MVRYRDLRGERIRNLLLVALGLCLAVSPYRYLQSTGEPAPAATPINLGDLKLQITQYKQSGAYDRDVAAVLARARQYVERRASMVRMPAIVLDIDDTSLSSWPRIQANDYGGITNGPCNLPAGPCGQISVATERAGRSHCSNARAFQGSESERRVGVFHHRTT